MRSLFATALSLLFAGVLASSTLAQVPQPTPTTQGSSNVVAPPAYQAAPIVNVAAYPPGGYGYYPASPYGSYLSGAADLVTARAQAGVTQQQAWLAQQDVYRSRLQSRQDLLNQARYEQNMYLNTEQMRQKNINDDLRRARRDPPLSEIWSGDSLNSLFTNIKNAQTYGVIGPAVPLNPDTLKHINLTTGVATSKGVGLLKDGAKLQWPIALQATDFQADRKKLDDMTAEAIQQAKSGMVAGSLISDMKAHVGTMQVVLKQMVDNVEPGPYIDAKKYLRELDTSYTALKDPNVANYFNGKYAAQGSTVYGLVDYMINNGLQFAPALAADQPSYTVLYQALLQYDVQLGQTASR